MSDELKPALSLPEAPPLPPRSPRGRLSGALIFLALGAILFLQYRVLVRPAAAPAEAPAAITDWREHALKLSQRNLHSAAARAWQRHLETLPRPLAPNATRGPGIPSPRGLSFTRLAPSRQVGCPNSISTCRATTLRRRRLPAQPSEEIADLPLLPNHQQRHRDAQSADTVELWFRQ